jgi:hypothetical protein
MLSVAYAECRKQAHYAECHYAECRYAECRGALWFPPFNVYSCKFLILYVGIVFVFWLKKGCGLDLMDREVMP